MRHRADRNRIMITSSFANWASDARIVSIIALLFIISRCDTDPDGSLEGSPQGNLGMDDKLQLPSNDELTRRVMRPLVEYGPGFAKKDAQPFDHRHAVNKLKKLFKLKSKLYGNAPKTSAAANKPPTTTTRKLSTATSKPSTTTTSKPSTTTSKPATSTNKPSTTTSKPSTTTSKPSTTTRKPSSTTRKPSTTTSKASTTTTTQSSNTTSKPSTTTRKPSTTKRKSSITASKLTTINKTVTPLKVIVNNKNKKQTTSKSSKTNS